MPVSEHFSRELWESAKWCLELSRSEKDSKKEQALLRASVLQGMSYLEAQILLIGEHFKKSNSLTTHEKAMLLEKNVHFKAGRYSLSQTTSFYRLEDKISLLSKVFKIENLTSESWWSPMQKAIKMRNLIAHPKEDLFLDCKFVSDALTAIIDCDDRLFKAVFGKKIPYHSFGLTVKANW